MKKTMLLLLIIMATGFLFSNKLLAQNRRVTGTVNADDGTLLFGVTVSIKGSSRATVTDNNGNFSIEAGAISTLVFSYIGYETKSVVVGANDNNISVSLIKSKLGNMDEVIVTAYGTQRGKRGLPYQAQTLVGDAIAESQRDNWLNALSGRIAGVNITPSSGVPGASTSIVLRGPVSIGGNNQPLIIVDGVPYDNQTLNQENLLGNAAGANRNSDYTNRAADINPNDIENMTVLKGPEATALYGSDGASGAIVITTKKGRSGKATINYDNSFRVEKVYRFPETQKVYGLGLNGINDPTATVNPFSAGPFYAYFGDKYQSGTKIYDNVKAFFRTGKSQRHNLNLDGGGNIATYRLSFSYTNQDGVVPMTGYSSMAAKISGTINVSPKLKIISSFGYLNSTTDKATKGAGGYLMDLLNFPANINASDYKNEDGSRKLFRQGSAAYSSEFDNPFWDVYKNRSQDKIDRTTTNFTINYQATKWLLFSNILGIDVYSQNGYNFVHPQSRYGVSTNGSYSLYEQDTRNVNNVTTGNVKWRLGKFNNAFITGYAIDNNLTKIEAQKGERFYELGFASINNTDPISRDAKTTLSNERKTRFFANYTIDYDKYIYLSFAGSREGNSKLMSRTINKSPYYNFGSASMSYIFTDMPILQNAISWLNFGKLRISYGITGKGPWSPYIIDNTFTSQITTGGGYAYGTTGNNFELKPEYTQNFEFGGEFRLFRDLLSIDITKYSLISKDQIIPARYSYGSGFVLKYLNGGKVKNQGIEAIVNIKAFKKQNFKWDITANFDRNRGKVLQMPSGLPTYYDSDTWIFGNLRSQMYAGASPYNLAAYSILKNANGIVVLSSTSGLPLNSGDFGIVGDRQPDFKLGLVNSFSYKNFSLNFNLEFRVGGDVWNGNEYFLYLTGGSTKTLDRETPIIIKGVLNDGLQNTTTPTYNTIVVTPLNRNDYYSSTTAVTEADFVERVNWMRLRDATLSYSLPNNVIRKTKFINKATIFVTGTEVFMFTNYSGADPSVSATTAASRGAGGVGIDFGALSTPRGFNFGFRAQF